MRVLLHHGLAYDDFAEVVKGVYAEVAREEAARLGKRATDSRVAIVTGLTRKEVRRLRDSVDADHRTISWGGANRATRVLSGWHRDADFTDAQGGPKELSLTDHDTGFPALVRRYSGDMPVSAMLDELERVRAVRRTRGAVRILKRAYVPEAGDIEGVRMLGSATHDLLDTIAYNLTRGADRPARFQRTVFDSRLDARMLPVFHRLAAEHAQKLLEILDDWLESHEVQAAGKESVDGRGIRAGLGVYVFHDPIDGAEEDTEKKR